MLTIRFDLAANTAEVTSVEHKNGKTFGAGKAITAAFRKDTSYPLEKLCEHIYGSSIQSRMNKLNQLLNYMTYTSGMLKKLGAKSYKVLGEPLVR